MRIVVVIPAEAAIWTEFAAGTKAAWIPALAGMTGPEAAK